jgi:predicted Zn-dependent peptidase
MPSITDKVLPNGMEIIVLENHELPVVYTRLVILILSAGRWIYL